LLGSCLGVSSCGRKEMFTGSHEDSLDDLRVILDDVNGVTILVDKGGNVCVSYVPIQFSAALLESLNECDGLVEGHVEPLGE
jgi:hypothetical protein